MLKGIILARGLYEVGEGRDLLEIVAGSLRVVGGTQIIGQNSLMNLFMSTCEISNSFLSQLKISDTPVRVTSSKMVLENVEITGVEDDSEKEIFLINVESEIEIMNLTYESSNARLLRTLSSQVRVEGMVVRNVTGFDKLMQIYSSHDIVLNDLSFFDLESSSSSIIQIENSNRISFDTFSINDTENTIVYIKNSNVTLMQNMKIENCSKPLSFIDSNIELLTESNFTHNGSQNDLNNGGVISISDSDVTITKSQFLNNTAVRAGAIDY